MGCLDCVVVNLLLMHGCGRSTGPLCNFDCEHKNRRQPFRLLDLSGDARALVSLVNPARTFATHVVYFLEKGTNIGNETNPIECSFVKRDDAGRRPGEKGRPGH
jgi:hypothetical protein